MVLACAGRELLRFVKFRLTLDETWTTIPLYPSGGFAPHPTFAHPGTSVRTRRFEPHTYKGAFPCSKSREPRRTFCDGVSRRNFLHIGAFGAGLTLADMLRVKPAQSANGKPTRAKSAIMIYLPGGPSHMDMYDLKPDAPAEFRGEFNPIDTNVPGVQICEHFPLQAKMWDKLACIRSIVAVDEHSDSLVMTGYSENVNRTANHPSFGSVVSKLRGSGSDVPPFVSLRGMCTRHRARLPRHRASAVHPERPGHREPATGRRRRRPTASTTARTCSTRFDDIRRDIDATGTMAGHGRLHQQAFDMVTSGTVRNALDLKKEDAEDARALQGRRAVPDRPPAGRSGRRLRHPVASAAGTRTARTSSRCKKQLPQVDRGVANLIQDLHDRGMDDDVVTVMWGEFGRTPKINMNAGRDHWSPVMSAMIAGGGLKMGQAVGASTARGERPKDRPYTRAAGAQHRLPRPRHRPGHDVPQRQRPADVHPRRPRAGQRIDLM